MVDAFSIGEPARQERTCRYASSALIPLEISNGDSRRASGARSAMQVNRVAGIEKFSKRTDALRKFPMIVGYPRPETQNPLFQNRLLHYFPEAASGEFKSGFVNETALLVATRWLRVANLWGARICRPNSALD